MSNFVHGKSLKSDNTFGIQSFASHYAEVFNDVDIIQLTDNYLYTKNKHLVIGAGANILFTSDFDGLIIKSGIKHIVIEREDNDYVYLKIGSGVVWNDVVKYALDHSLYGIENLIDIPGLCGGAVVQNIGAYGCEISDVIDKVRAYRMNPPRSFIELSNSECHFGYRHSIFKEKDYFNSYLVTEITIRLSKVFTPNIRYRLLEQTLSDNRISTPSAIDIAETISHLRSSRLPDTKKIGCAGSFFMNPIVIFEDYKDVVDNYKLSVFPIDEKFCKLSAAQLIEIAGFKGFRSGDAGVYDKHALILCNYGNASGEEIYNLALQIVEKVNYMFGLKLIPEVLVW